MVCLPRSPSIRVLAILVVLKLSKSNTSSCSLFPETRMSTLPRQVTAPTEQIESSEDVSPLPEVSPIFLVQTSDVAGQRVEDGEQGVAVVLVGVFAFALMRAFFEFT